MGSPAPNLPAPLDRILPRFVSDLRWTLAGELVGVYTFGSAISGGFDPALSDLDVVVVTASDIDRLPLEPLVELIRRLQAREPAWASRLDVAMIGRETVAHFRDGGGAFAEISHATPFTLFHRADEWLETWFLARDANTALHGPSPAVVIPPISIDEFLAAVVGGLDGFIAAEPGWPDEKVAYRVLTLCRVLLSLESRRLCSKGQGATWARARYPADAAIIEAAWEVRAGHGARAFTATERSAALALLPRLARDAREAQER